MDVLEISISINVRVNASSYPSKDRIRGTRGWYDDIVVATCSQKSMSLLKKGKNHQ
jgi:hypothetical protein